MKAFQQFDLMRRGVRDVVEQWQADHDEVRDVWAVEDVLAAINKQFFPLMRTTFRGFENGVLPVSQWAQVSELLSKLTEVTDIFKKFGSSVKRLNKKYDVEGLHQLTVNLHWMKEVTAALKKELAALKKIEDKSPRNKELLATVGRCRPPASWYASTDMF